MDLNEEENSQTPQFFMIMAYLRSPRCRKLTSTGSNSTEVGIRSQRKAFATWHRYICDKSVTESGQVGDKLTPEDTRTQVQVLDSSFSAWL